MILKVRHDIESKNRVRHDWLYFDGFNRARFLSTPIPMLEVREGAEHYDYVVGCDYDSNSDSAHMVEIIRDGIKYTIVFDSVAYLLNDAGKTVDTFQAYNPVTDKSALIPENSA